MAYETPEAVSALSPLAALFGGGNPQNMSPGPAGGGASNPLNAIIAALMKSGQGSSGSPSPAPTGTYEGNIQTPANPLNPDTSSFGMTPKPPMPPPQAGGAPPSPFTSGTSPVPFLPPGGPSSQPPAPPPANPFTQGAPPTPFLNTGALFGRPPIGGSPLSAVAQRPNPISSMQL